MLMPRCVMFMQRRCYWKLAGNPNIVLMHYRSPVPRKDSEIQGATPLHLQTRVPVSATYNAVPTSGHAEVAGPVCAVASTAVAAAAGEHKAQPATTALQESPAMDVSGVPPPHEAVPPAEGVQHGAEDNLAAAHQAPDNMLSGHQGASEGHRQAWEGSWAQQEHLVRHSVLGPPIEVNNAITGRQLS
jgi:hypothetical protein